MTEKHPITPPPELVQAFLRSNPFTPAEMTYEQFIATRFARWGADQELEACCQALYRRYDIPSCIPPKVAEEMRDWLRATRRPKPPSLKEQALEALNEAVYMADDSPPEGISTDQADIIRRALEQLDD